MISRELLLRLAKVNGRLGEGVVNVLRVQDDGEPTPEGLSEFSGLLGTVAAELHTRAGKLDDKLTVASLREIARRFDRVAVRLQLRAHELDGGTAVAGALKPPAPRQTTRSRPDTTRRPADS